MVTYCFVGIRCRNRTFGRLLRGDGDFNGRGRDLLRHVLTGKFPTKEIKGLLKRRIENGEDEVKFDDTEFDYDFLKWAPRLPEVTTKSHGRKICGIWTHPIERYNYIVDVEEEVVYMLSNQFIVAEVLINSCSDEDISEIIGICKERSERCELEANKYWPTVAFCRFNGWPST